MTTKITANQLNQIEVITSGRMESHLTLNVPTQAIVGQINGHEVRKSADMQSMYNLFSYIDTLELPNGVIPAGQPPRGQTFFILTYQSGQRLTLALNPNSPEGQAYYELSTDQFQKLFDLWGSL